MGGCPLYTHIYTYYAYVDGGLPSIHTYIYMLCICRRGLPSIHTYIYILYICRWRLPCVPHTYTNYAYVEASLVAQMVKRLTAMQETTALYTHTHIYIHIMHV